MGFRPRPKDKIQKVLEREELLEFARQGGSPKNAPQCYGSFYQEKTKRQTRHCNGCDSILQEMCIIRGENLKKFINERKQEYEKMKDVIAMEYEVRASGNITNAKFERLKRRVR